MLWMEAIMTKVRSYLDICKGWQRKTARKASDLACIPTVIQIGPCRSTCQKRYLLSEDFYFGDEKCKSQG